MDSVSLTSSSNVGPNLNMQQIEVSGWTAQHEDIFIEWADKAMIYRWMHTRSYKIFYFRNACYTIPVIIMSTLTGTATFGQDRIPEAYRIWAQIAIGTINISAGIITTIQQFLKINELLEAHRVSSISWGKFYENIKIELAKHPKDRDGPLEMLKHFKEEFDRLMEISPTIEDAVINEFKSRFGSKKNKTQLNETAITINSRFGEKFRELFTNDDMIEENDEMHLQVQSIFSDYMKDVKNLNKSKSKNHYAYLKKPDICDELVSTTDMVHQWYLKPKNKKEEIVYKEDPEAIKEIELRKEREIYKRLLDEFCRGYYNINEREPFDDEILENMERSIPKQILLSLIEQRTENVMEDSTYANDNAFHRPRKSKTMNDT